MRNTVIGCGTASVDGKVTGLAGCNRLCGRDCLRKDPKLTYRWTPEPWGDSCPYFIPVTSLERTER